MTKEIKAKLVERVKRTPSIESFRFIFPVKLDFLPGQFAEVIFDEEERKNRELNKYLSFSSSPAKSYREVTKRLSESKFSKCLRGLKTGDEVLFKGPLGSCVFREEDKEIAFLIGGIGITPVVSIIEYIVEKKLNSDFSLFYSNKSKEEIAFKEELDYFQNSGKQIKVVYTLTDYPPEAGDCVFGKIDKGLVLKECPDLDKRVVFIFGPPKMVASMKNISLEAGCRKEKIKTESFIGY